MAQVNKYTDRAAYTADTKRLSTKSAVSLITEDGTLIYDGVNVVVEKGSADIGDLAVYDKADGIIRYIEGSTLVKDQIPADLISLAVVYARKGDKVLIVSLDNATFNGSASVRWAASYEVALSGFDLAAGGTFTLKINATDYSFTYAVGATLEDIAALINANTTIKTTYGWTAAADMPDARVIMTANTATANYATIDVASGCEITRTPENKNYQTTLTGVLIEGSTEYIRRNNGVNSSFAGCNPEKFLQYYSANGGTNTNVSPGSTTIIRESVFTEEANPELVAAYPTYRDYLLGEHMTEYPSACGTMLRDGKTNTELIGKLRFIDIHGESVPCYPAAATALDYGVIIENATTGLEAGAWWLPSVEEIYLLMHDRVLTSADQESDPVNRTLARLGKAALYGSGLSPWSSCEYGFNGAFFYTSGTGGVSSSSKYNPYFVRPVSIL